MQAILGLVNSCHEWASEQKGMNEQTKKPERALPQHGTEVQLSKSDGSRACANTAGVSLVAGVYISLATF